MGQFSGARAAVKRGRDGAAGRCGQALDSREVLLGRALTMIAAQDSNIHPLLPDQRPQTRTGKSLVFPGAEIYRGVFSCRPWRVVSGALEAS